MNTNSCLHDDAFTDLLKRLPAERNEHATQLGVITRKRKIRDVDILLRLVLAYSMLDLSLRGVVAWARQLNIVHIADVSLLERLQKSTPFLAWLLMRMLQDKTKAPVFPGLPYRVQLIDATVICEPGSKGTDWRVHMQMDLSTQSIRALTVTDHKVGEGFKRFHVHKDDLLIGDRIYATRSSISHVVGSGGDVLVRFAWQNLPLQNRDGTTFDLMGHLAELKTEGQVSEWDVCIAPKAPFDAISGRVIAVRKTASACEKARCTAKKNAKKKGHTIDERTLITCDYLLLFTTVDTSIVQAETMSNLYRFRWQIECGFKRLKSLLNLDGLRAKNDALCQAYLYGKLIGALLTDQCCETWADFSPWGETGIASDFDMALVPDGRDDNI